MRKATLYHPGFEPEQSWLRAMLLFYDCVHSIVPEKAGYEPSPSITPLYKSAAFVPIAPAEKDLDYDWGHYHALSNVLRRLSERGESADRLRARLDWSGGVPSLDLKRGVKVHTDKMADMLAYDLVNFGLAERMNEEWLRVDQRVADLVLSMLADRMKMNRPEIACTSSDQETSFAVAAKSELGRSDEKSWNVDATLASAILKAEIPADIADLPMDRYLDIRKHYEDKREVFWLAMHEIQTLYLERSFQSAEAFNKEIKHAVEKFDREMQKLREQRLGNQVRRWVPVALGGIVSLAAAAVPDRTIALAAAGVTLTLQVLQTSQGEPVRGTNKAEAQALLVEVGRDISWNRSWLGRVLSW